MQPRLNSISTATRLYSGSKAAFSTCIKFSAEGRPQTSQQTSPPSPSETAVPSATHGTPPQQFQGNQTFHSPASTLSNRPAKAEHYTDTFANSFLRATLYSLQRRLTQDMAWYDDQMCILTLYFLFPTLLTSSSEQEMRITLGSTGVTVRSDGGLSFYPNPASSDNHPVLCIEVSSPLQCTLIRP